jgi:hypothetical protein
MSFYSSLFREALSQEVILGGHLSLVFKHLYVPQ